MSKILELAKRIASTGGLETKTTETISGTYDSTGQQRLLSHAYKIGGNLTITNGELILSRLANNGTDMTLEFGSDVTLTGDGTLMLGDLGQGQPNQDFSASRITGKLPSTVFPTGHVLQVFSTTMTVPSTLNPGSAWVDISGLTVNITPSSTSSKVLITGIVSVIGRDGYNNAGLRVLRNGSETGYQGDSSGSRSRAFSSIVGDKTNDATGEHAMNYLDSPSSTSVLTYKVQTKSNNVVYINRSYSNADNANQYIVASTITVMEMAG